MGITPIYLDSNVLIDLADGREDELLGLILRSIYTGRYVYPFSAEQISEITQQDQSARNDLRLMLLSDVSRQIYFENSMNMTGFKQESPKSVYETINEVAIAKDWESNIANFITFQQQLDVRKAYGLTTENLNNLTAKQAIAKIDLALASYRYDVMPCQVDPPKSLAEFIKFNEDAMRSNFASIWEQMSADPEVQLENGRIVSLFSLFDTFGFWSDSKETYKKGSRLADSRHAFNGSYYSMIISRDKRLLKKSEAAYSYFDISTEALTTSEFKIHLQITLSTRS